MTTYLYCWFNLWNSSEITLCFGFWSKPCSDPALCWGSTAWLLSGCCVYRGCPRSRVGLSGAVPTGSTQPLGPPRCPWRLSHSLERWHPQRTAGSWHTMKPKPALQGHSSGSGSALGQSLSRFSLPVSEDETGWCEPLSSRDVPFHGISLDGDRSFQTEPSLRIRTGLQVQASTVCNRLDFTSSAKMSVGERRKGVTYCVNIVLCTARITA